MLPARHRLRQRADFTAVLRGPGAGRAGGRLIVVHAHRTDARAQLPPRIGFVVSGAVGNAVVRNRTKRRLRAAVATQLRGIPSAVDLVVRANPTAARANYGDLEAALQRQLISVVTAVVDPTASRA